MQEIVIHNRQRTRRVNTAVLRGFTRHPLDYELQLNTFALGIELVGKRNMADINWRFLQHQGPTDIITFDHHDPTSPDEPALHGELFICLPVAEAQAAEFGTRWFEELARYVIHGILHLRGFDDLTPAERRRMKREEGRLLRRMIRVLPLSHLGRAPTLRAHEA